MWDLFFKNGTNELIYKTKIVTDIENQVTVTRKGVRERINWEAGIEIYTLSSVQFSSVSQSCPILCNPMNRSTPGLPVHHQLPEFTQTQAHRVGDAIQSSHPLSSPSPPAPNPSQHQGLFEWVNCLHQVAKVLEFQLQHVKWASLVAQLVKNLPAMQEAWVRSLGWEDPLKKGKAAYSSIPAWRIPWTV